MKRRYDPEKILSKLDEKEDIHFDPFLASKVLHVHKMQLKGRAFQSRFKVSLIGFAMLLLLFMNGFSVLKQYQTTSQSADVRLASVKQLSETYFSNNE